MLYGQQTEQAINVAH